MGLLMFLAVTASLLGYCQTDEKGKTHENHDSRPSFAYRIPFFSSLSLSHAPAFYTIYLGCGGNVERNTDFAFRIVQLSDEDEGRRE